MGLGNWNRLRGHRGGIMLHYDDSRRDQSAVEWLTIDERCKVSYNDLILDDGHTEPIAPEDARAWHAGVCRPSVTNLAYTDANSYFYGIAIAANGNDHITKKQFDATARRCVELFRKNGWSYLEMWRITSHSKEAWPRGRKVDIEGTRKNDPVCSVESVRSAVQAIFEGHYNVEDYFPTA